MNNGTEHLRRTPVRIDGTTYDLCGEFGALIAAESYYADRIRGFNLAAVLFTWGQDRASIVDGCRHLLPAALRTFHPEVSYEEAQGMIDQAVAADNPGLFTALWNMWRPDTEETESANDHLRCDLEFLAMANEFFEGKPGLLQICVEDDGFNLRNALGVFACAVHHFRPELSFADAGALLTLKGLRLVIGLMGIVNQTALQEERDKFAERTYAAASEQDQKIFLFRVLAKRPWPGVAQA